MPGRRIIFANKKIYHLFNKTIGNRRIFEHANYCRLFLKTLNFYRSEKATISFSKLSTVPSQIRDSILKEIGFQKYFKVNILAFCLMPNHYHLLVEQLVDKGVSKFVSDSMNSFTRHVNTTKDAVGPIFLTKFKAILIESEAQLKHVSRYIELNPFSSGVVRSISELPNYPWSSFNQYIKGQSHGDLSVDRSLILSLFNNDPERYRKFVEDNADYQRSLEIIKHVQKWK